MSFEYNPQSTSLLKHDIIKDSDVVWTKDLKDYQKSKKELPWLNDSEYLPPSKEVSYYYHPKIISHSMVYKLDNTYNPITQKYIDENENIRLREIEKKNQVNKLAINYDNSLKKIQTYDIINRRDKFEAFKGDPLYKNVIKKSNDFRPRENREISKVDYNIISNISLDEHSFLPPEERPKINASEGNLLNSKVKKKIDGTYRDYNIINNRYNKFHNEKMIVESEIEKLNSAKKFYDTAPYDILKCVSNNAKEQEKYLQDLKDERDRLFMLRGQKNISKVNPVNCQINDKPLVEMQDLKEKKKIHRYTLREGINDYYRNLDYYNENKRNQEINNRVSYYNYKISDQRGYDILNFNNIYNKYKESTAKEKNCKQLNTDWDVILQKSGDNRTFEEKGIYKNPYDSSDVDRNRHSFILKRNEMVKNLPRLEDDETFKGYAVDFGKRNKEKSYVSLTEGNIRRNNGIFNGKKLPIIIDKKSWYDGKNDKNINDLKFSKIFSNNDVDTLQKPSYGFNIIN